MTPLERDQRDQRIARAHALEGVLEAARAVVTHALAAVERRRSLVALEQALDRLDAVEASLAPARRPPEGVDP
jgi:hypothetical protein